MQWLILLLPFTLLARDLEEGSRKAPEFQARLYGLTARRASDATQDLVMSPRSPGRAVLSLRFEQGTPGLLQDDAGNYRLKADYVRGENGPSGAFAQFVKPENRIELRSPPELWPGRGEMGDFTIQFWIKPVIFYRQSVVLKKAGLLDGAERGIEIRLDSGRVQAALTRILSDEEGNLTSTTLSAAAPLDSRRWSHVALTYDRAKNRLALYIDNREQMVRTLSPSQSLVFHPQDRSPIVVGESFFGSIDEVTIYDHAANPEYDRVTVLPAAQITESRVSQSRALALSKVYNTGSVSSARLEYRAHEPPGSLIAFYVRTSKHPFPENARDSGELAWRRVNGSTDRLGRFAYFQWKAVFQASPAGDASPVLESVMLSTHESIRPMRPGGLRVVPELSGPDYVCLEWRKSPEPEVDESGRYTIYYGQTPGELTGRIRVSAGKALRSVPFEQMPLTPAEKQQMTYRASALRRELSSRVRIIVTNQMITENAAAHPRHKDMPFFEADRAYYFAVTAESPEGESDLSREAVTVLADRPDL